MAQFEQQTTGRYEQGEHVHGHGYLRLGRHEVARSSLARVLGVGVLTMTPSA